MQDVAGWHHGDEAGGGEKDSKSSYTLMRDEFSEGDEQQKNPSKSTDKNN